MPAVALGRSSVTFNINAVASHVPNVLPFGTSPTICWRSSSMVVGLSAHVVAFKRTSVLIFCTSGSKRVVRMSLVPLLRGNAIVKMSTNSEWSSSCGLWKLVDCDSTFTDKLQNDLHHRAIHIKVTCLPRHSNIVAGVIAKYFRNQMSKYRFRIVA